MDTLAEDVDLGARALCFRLQGLGLKSVQKKVLGGPGLKKGPPVLDLRKYDLRKALLPAG